ncbi:phage portal protein [uncultured Rothia sp.]|uniref:phage portal protein n=1 Tax=uncultured Rothia sp. TaxID=316088 RepID=UPI003217D0DE
MAITDLDALSSCPVNYSRWDDYYYGRARLDAIGVSLPPDVRVLELSAMWPKLAVDVLVESLVLEGFSLAGGKVPESLRKALQINNFDTVFPLALTEALVQGRSYVAVGRDEQGYPLITAHTAKGMQVRRDSRGKITEALKSYRSGLDHYQAHYQPGLISYYRGEGESRQFLYSVKTDTDFVPLVEIVNKVRVDDRGHSEIADIARLCDAASRSLTNLQVAQELLSMPVRYLFGDGATDERVDADGNRVSAIQAYFGRFLVGEEGSTAGQIPGADLQQILNTFKLYAQQVSAMTGIPPFMMGVSADSNPSSAEAMQSAKDRLSMRASVKQNIFGDAAEDIARMVLAVLGEDVEGLETLEARWRDPAVASISARNAQMLQAQAQGVVSAQTARESLSLTPEQLARESSRDDFSSAVVGD